MSEETIFENDHYRVVATDSGFVMEPLTAKAEGALREYVADMRWVDEFEPDNSYFLPTTDAFGMVNAIDELTHRLGDGSDRLLVYRSIDADGTVGTALYDSEHEAFDLIALADGSLGVQAVWCDVRATETVQPAEPGNDNQ